VETAEHYAIDQILQRLLHILLLYALEIPVRKQRFLYVNQYWLFFFYQNKYINASNIVLNCNRYWKLCLEEIKQVWQKRMWSGKKMARK